jgi:hypothetical protein
MVFRHQRRLKSWHSETFLDWTMHYSSISLHTLIDPIHLSGLVDLLQPRLPRNLLGAALKVRVRVANGASDSVESEARRLGRELHFSANMEESKVSID